MTAVRIFLAALVGCILATGAGAQILGIATNPQGTAGYSTGAAIARVLEDKAGLKARPQPIGGSSTYLPMVNRGEIEFGLCNGAEAQWAHAGAETFAGKANPNLRLVFVTYPIHSAIVVAADSPHKVIADLKGARIASEFVAQTIFKALQDAHLASVGLSVAEMKAVPVRNFGDGLKALAEGKIDATIAGASTAVALETNAAMSRQGGVRYLPLETSSAAMARMQAVMPGSYADTVAPSPAMPGVRATMPLMVNSNFLVAGAHVAAESVYDLVKAMHANKPVLVEGYVGFRGFAPQAMSEASPVPYHAGAEKFYREIGQWPPKPR